jgi:broad specificity phosphatase PhoE
MRIFLVRHGQNLANITREFSYRKVDYSLTDLGRQQASHTAEYLRAFEVAHVAASPLKRAMETAEPIARAHNLPLAVIEQFREINSGDLEGMPPTEENWKLHDDVMDAWLREERHAQFPGGEDYYGLEARVAEGLRELVSAPGHGVRVAVSHGGAIFGMTRLLCPESNVSELWYSVGLPNCSITEIELDAGDTALHGRLVRFGDNSHIPGAKPGW